MTLKGYYALRLHSRHSLRLLIDHLLCAAGRCLILLEGEVIWQLFDIKQVLSYEVSHHSIDEMKISALRCQHSDTINKLLNIGRHRIKRQGAMSSFANNI